MRENELRSYLKNIRASLCGKCIKVCSYTQKYTEL